MGPLSALSPKLHNSTFFSGLFKPSASAARVHQAAEARSLRCPICQKTVISAQWRMFSGLETVARCQAYKEPTNDRLIVRLWWLMLPLRRWSITTCVKWPQTLQFPACLLPKFYCLSVVISSCPSCLGQLNNLIPVLTSPIGFKALDPVDQVDLLRRVNSV